MNNYIKKIVEAFDFDSVNNKKNINATEKIYAYLQNKIYNKLPLDKEDYKILKNSPGFYTVVNKKELNDLIGYAIELFGNHCDLNWLDVSLLTDLSCLFLNHRKFNGDISKWDVSNVTEISAMFFCSEFNGDISKWNVSNVKRMVNMFHESKFNGDISDWDVSNVVTMENMFFRSKFAGDLNKWLINPELELDYTMFMGTPLEDNPPIWYKALLKKYSLIDEAFDFDSVDDKNKSLQITKKLKDYILTDTCEKIRNIFIEKRKLNYALYIGNNDRFYELQVKDIKDTLDKFCYDSEVEVRGKTIPALEYRHPVLYGPNWLLGWWKDILAEKFRKKKANEDKIYYKDLPKDVRKLWEDIIKEMNFVGDIRVSDDFTFMAAIDPSKNKRGAIYQIFLTGHKKYTPDGKEITEIKESQNIINANALYLYHATPACYINSIKKYGLGGKLPKRRFWDYEGTPYENIKYGCFFATDEYVAESYVENSESFEELAEEYEDRYDKELEIAVFQIDINDLDLSKLSIDTNQIVEDGDDPTYFYDGIIPYSKLKRIKLY